MSREGNFYAETWREGHWEPIPTPKRSKDKQIPVACVYPGTAYSLYTALVGYERRYTYPFWHTEPIVPIAEPRGFPDDMNLLYKEAFFTGLTDSFLIKRLYLTWFLVQEVIDYNWDKKFPPWTGYVKRQYASLFKDSGSFPEDFPDDEGVYPNPGKNRGEVSWIESYREFVGYGDWFIEELLKLGNPQEVRIIFWLDW